MEYQLITGIFILQAMVSITAKNRFINWIGFGFATLLACVLCWDLLLTDYLPYQDNYNDLATQNFSNEAFLEPGWILLQQICINLGLGFQVFRIAILGVLLSLTYYFYASFLKTPVLAMVVYVSLLFYPDSYMLRASLAQSILGVAFIFFFLHDRKIAGCITLLMAASVHYSALVAAPVFFVGARNITSCTALISMILIVALQPLEVGSNLLDFLSALDVSYIGHKLAIYEGSVHFEEAKLGFAAFIWLAVTAVYATIARDNWQHRGAILAFGLAGVGALFVFSDLTVIANRLFRLFCPIYPLMLALIVQNMKVQSNFLASSALLSLSALGSFFVAPHQFSQLG